MMATAPKTTIGTMACMCCGREIPVKQAENGTLNVACGWCDFPAYAKKGTEAHALVMKRTKRTPGEPQAEPAAQPKPPAPPTAAQANAAAPKQTQAPVPPKKTASIWPGF